MRLDDTQARANLAILTKQLDELTARQAREEASEMMQTRFSFPVRADEPKAATTRWRSSLPAQQRLFDIRRKARAGQKAQLNERIAQLRQEIEGLNAQEAAKLSGNRVDSQGARWGHGSL